MADLLKFIRKTVGTELVKARLVKSARLIVVTTGTRDPLNLSAGPTRTETTVRCKGLVVQWRKQFLGATTVMAGDRVIMLTGKSLGATEPKIGDKITIESKTSRVIDVERDPAAATFTCLTRA